MGVPQEAFEDEGGRLASEVAWLVPLSVALLTGLLLLYSLPGRCPSTRPLQALLAVLSVILSLLTTLGFLAALNFDFNPIVAVSPYLIIAIGVDDSFLILGVWRGDLGSALGEVGPAIAVTTATDALTFLVGAALSQTPAMSRFCLFTAVALLMDFLYQVTFFVALLVYSRRAGRACGSAEWLGKRLGRRKVAAKGTTLQLVSLEGLGGVGKDDVYQLPSSSGSSGSGSHSSLDSSPNGGMVGVWLGSSYARFLLRPPVRVGAALAYLAYLGVALLGCASLTINISPHKLTLQGQSPINDYFTLAVDHIYREYVPVSPFS